MEHEALIARLAHQLYKKTHLYDFEDLFQVGLQSAFRLDKSYNEKLAKKTTFYTFCIKRDMIKFIAKYKKNFSDTCYVTTSVQSPIEASSLWEFLPDLNTRDTEIVNLLANGYTKSQVSKNLKMTAKQLKVRLERIGRLIDG